VAKNVEFFLEVAIECSTTFFFEENCGATLPRKYIKKPRRRKLQES
jgi:hypothetical protein